jgi:hypothetical protein
MSDGEGDEVAIAASRVFMMVMPVSARQAGRFRRLA